MSKKDKLKRLVELKVMTGYDIGFLLDKKLYEFQDKWLNEELLWFKKNHSDLLEYDDFNFIV